MILNDTLAFFLFWSYFCFVFFFCFVLCCFASYKGEFIYSSQDLKDAGIFLLIVAHLLSFMPTSMHTSTETHSEVFGDAGKLHSPCLVNGRPQTYHSLLPSLPLFAESHMGKQRWPVCVVKSQMLSSSCPGSIPTSQQMYEYFLSPSLQIRACILPNTANKFQKLQNEGTHGTE